MVSCSPEGSASPSTPLRFSLASVRAMHRTRSKFAARVHRVATGLERRGVVATYELHDRLLATRASRRRYTHEPASLDGIQESILERLRKEGYAKLPFSELVTDAAVWSELEQDAARFIADTEAGLAAEEEGGEGRLRRPP